MEKFKMLSNKMGGRNSNSAAGVKNPFCCPLTFNPFNEARVSFLKNLCLTGYLTLKNSLPFTLVAHVFGKWPSRNMAYSALT